ncbi:MAG TPA: LuxR C-terminal-related transcriptional regulator, partial [Verrucomicrobiae bacterium]
MRNIATTEDPTRKVSKPAAADVVVAGICLPETADIKWADCLKEKYPSIAILMLAENADFERIMKALKVGPGGYLLRRGAVKEIVDAISEVKEAGGPMGNLVVRKAIKSFRVVAPAKPGASNLSGREQEILAQLSKGYANKEIAGQMHVSLS